MTAEHEVWASFAPGDELATIRCLKDGCRWFFIVPTDKAEEAAAAHRQSPDGHRPKLRVVIDEEIEALAAPPAASPTPADDDSAKASLGSVGEIAAPK